MKQETRTDRLRAIEDGAGAARDLHSDVAMTSGKAIARAGLIGMSLVAMLTFSCLRAPAGLHDLTYPPDFSYLPAEELRSAMWVLAVEISLLDELLRIPPEASADGDARNQDAIGACLSRLGEAVKRIDEPGRVTQHPALNRNLHRFAERIEQARRAAGRTPPNYFQASALSGSCFLCHGSAEERMAL